MIQRRNYFDDLFSLTTTHTNKSHSPLLMFFDRALSWMTKAQKLIAHVSQIYWGYLVKFSETIFIQQIQDSCVWATDSNVHAIVLHSIAVIAKNSR